MRRYPSICVVSLVGVALLAPTGAADDPYVIRLEGRRGVLLGLDERVGVFVEHEKEGAPGPGPILRFGKSREEWRIGTGPGGGKVIRITVKDEQGRWYLSCDHRGKDRSVFLSPEPVPGSYWSVPSRNTGTIRSSAEGPFHGWGIALGPAERFQTPDSGLFRGHRLQMAPEGARFKVSETSP